MVLYYGRAKQRVGSVNTKQRGLKMSGCPSRVGRNPVNTRYIAQRVKCKLKLKAVEQINLAVSMALMVIQQVQKHENNTVRALLS